MPTTYTTSPAAPGPRSPVLGPHLYVADVPCRLRDGRRQPHQHPLEEIRRDDREGRHREDHRLAPMLTPQRHQLPHRHQLAARVHQEPRERHHRNQPHRGGQHVSQRWARGGGGK
ncbi:hypothetical protein GCM10009646_23180 [Streptomyces aureus]